MNLPAHRIPQWEICSVGDDQDLPAAQDEHKDKMSGNTDNSDVQSVYTGSNDMVYTGDEDGMASPGDLLLIEAPSQSNVLTEPHPVLGGDPTGGATTLEASGGPKKDEPPSEQMKFNDTKRDGNSSSSQTRLNLMGSTVASIQEPLELVVPPTHLTVDHSLGSHHTVTEPPENHTAGRNASPWSWPQKSDPHQTQPRPPSAPSVDLLPIFTNQRPVDLPTTKGQWALSTTRDIISPYQQRYI